MYSFTKHAIMRMNQRGITRNMIELTLNYGKSIKDKIALTRKEINKLIKKYPQLKQDFIKLLDKGGLILVVKNNYIITLYKPKKGIING